MKTEKPLPFAGAMVRAIFANIKTQTRRGAGLDEINEEPENFELLGMPAIKGRLCGLFAHIKTRKTLAVRVRYGLPDETLWMKENYGFPAKFDAMKPSECIKLATPIYFADGAPEGIKQRPSIHMPRAASRLNLINTGTTFERLKSITEADAIAEGLSKISKDDGRTWKYGIPDRDGMPGTDNDGWPWSDWSTCPRAAYFHLWDKINGEGAASLNPWVQRVTFRR